MKKKKIDKKIIIIGILILILVGIIFLYIRNNNIDISYSDILNKNITTENNGTQLAETLTSNGEITSALTEKIELHATYYLEESYIGENKYIDEDENLIKYTNGEYLKSPYNCVIKSFNIPDIEEQCTNENYIELGSTNQLKMEINVSETNIDKVYIGQVATITVPALENKQYTGYITSISSTATNGNFTTIVTRHKGTIKALHNEPKGTIFLVRL